jgi:hypothetical protein
MKKLLLAAGLVASVAMFAGCASTGNTTQQTPAQIAAVVCPAVQAELSTLSAAGVFTGGAATTLASQVTPDVNAVCAAGAQVTSTNLQNLVNVTVPVVATIVTNSPMTPQDKLIAILALGGAQTIFNTAMGIVNAQTVASTASAVAVASAAKAAAQ